MTNPFDEQKSPEPYDSWIDRKEREHYERARQLARLEALPRLLDTLSPETRSAAAEVMKRSQAELNQADYAARHALDKTLSAERKAKRE